MNPILGMLRESLFFAAQWQLNLLVPRREVGRDGPVILCNPYGVSL